jgi:DNA (cytosine-5)-methyltransferase 1
MLNYTCAGLFSGGGGLDLGFEMAGFSHLYSSDWDKDCIATLQKNRPDWNVIHADVRSFCSPVNNVDVLLAGFPCQGFSLGGNRDESDERNSLFNEVVRIAKQSNARVVVIENVLNLRNMRNPKTGRLFITDIASAFRSAGYEVFSDFLRMSRYGVPQTRRRFLFVAFRERAPVGYSLPVGSGEQSARPFLNDLAHGLKLEIPNHAPIWNFPSQVHHATGDSFNSSDPIFPVRFSRTASDGNPLRSLDAPFPAVDTATIWGWAQGSIRVERVFVDRGKHAKFIRNRSATHKLWRITASRLRSFTDREYARLQTFPDSWAFEGLTKRSVHIQIGNAVPVEFAHRLAFNIKEALMALDSCSSFESDLDGPCQLSLNVA